MSASAQRGREREKRERGIAENVGDSPAEPLYSIAAARNVSAFFISQIHVVLDGGFADVLTDAFVVRHVHLSGEREREREGGFMEMA